MLQVSSIILIILSYFYSKPTQTKPGAIGAIENNPPEKKQVIIITLLMTDKIFHPMFTMEPEKKKKNRKGVQLENFGLARKLWFSSNILV